MLQKFKQAIKLEFFIYIIMLLFLTIVMHSDILSDPSSRFQFMYEKGNYSHPFLYTFIIYIILFIIRKTLDFIIGLFETKTS
jgi:hypothetical protein